MGITSQHSEISRRDDYKSMYNFDSDDSFTSITTDIHNAVNNFKYDEAEDK